MNIPIWGGLTPYEEKVSLTPEWQLVVTVEEDEDELTDIFLLIRFQGNDAPGTDKNLTHFAKDRSSLPFDWSRYEPVGEKPPIELVNYIIQESLGKSELYQAICDVENAVSLLNSGQKPDKSSLRGISRNMAVYSQTFFSDEGSIESVIYSLCPPVPREGSFSTLAPLDHYLKD